MEDNLAGPRMEASHASECPIWRVVLPPATLFNAYYIYSYRAYNKNQKMTILVGQINLSHHMS
jgi:hypothetical protein